MENILFTRKATALFNGTTQLTDYIFDEVKVVDDFFILYSSTLLLIIKKDATPVLYDKISDTGIIQPLHFDSVFVFDKGIKVIKDGLSGCYSFEGVLILPIAYAGLYFRPLGIEVVEDGFVGLFSYDGKLIIPIEFTSIVNFYTKKIEVSKNGETFYYSYDGTLI